MVNFILRRLAQSIPQLFLISLILFLLMQAFGDPIASLGVRTPPKPADRERLRRQLGLDQPVYVQYLVWLAGNDWMKIDMDGDGVAETPGKRRGVIRGDLSPRSPAWRFGPYPGAVGVVIVENYAAPGGVAWRDVGA